ncbi:MAG: hypothetical protein U0W24_09730 [Bacteroidales bacterium]
MRKIISIILVIHIISGLKAQDQPKIDSLSLKLPDSKADSIKFRICREIAELYSNNNLKKSMEYANLSLDYAKKSGVKLFELRATITIGNNFLFLGNYNQALDSYLKVLKESQKNNFISEELISTTHIGIIKDRLNQFDEALKYYFEALAIYNNSVEKGIKLDGIKYIHPLYNNIGNIYNSKKEYETAISYYKKGLDIAEQKKDKINIGAICNNMGKLEIERGNHQTGYYYLKKALKARIEANDQSGISKSYLFIANYFKTTGNLDSAAFYAEKSLTMAKKMNEMLTIENSNSMLFEIYYALGDYKKALDYHIQFKNASDSLTSNSNIEKMTRLQMQFEYEKAEKEKEEQRLTLRNTYIITVFGLVVIVLIFILLFFLARSRNARIQLEKSKLEEDMIMKNKELTTNVMYLLQKNELINNISVRLLKLKDSMKEENKRAVQGIIHDLQSIADKDIWEEFELRFQNVHQGFYDNLKKRFPDLTPAEIKLAAFLKLNMTTKEISSITGQAANSIETARYRLRKKLGITNQEVNLVNFLLQF